MESRNLSMTDDTFWDELGGLDQSNEFQDALTNISPQPQLGDLVDYTHTSLDYTPLPASSSNMGPPPTGVSAESSSQDSASDSSSRRKRKVTESPLSDAATAARVKKEDSMMDFVDSKHMSMYETYPTQPMDDLSIGQDDNNMFDFASAASSPAQPHDFHSAANFKTRGLLPTSRAGMQYQQSPVQSLNPGMFQLGTSPDMSPIATNTMIFNNASPNALLSSASSNSEDTFAGNQGWNGSMAQNPAWPTDYNQYASPGALAFTPSPVVNGATPASASRSSAAPPPPLGRSALHIAPISTKSRVETQINVVMTLEKPPPGIEHLHLPLHTIAKSKLLAKEEVDKSATLELYTMLVCTSAMSNPVLRERTLRRAAEQDNGDIQRRAERLREASEDERSDLTKVEDEADRPANGGEVRICNNCIQRERKRAGRKKLKKEEEQQHWERYETERVVVFNSNEYLPFKPASEAANHHDASQQHVDDVGYTPPEGALQVAAAMRIACYCRHQGEKEGFRVIFTLKDCRGAVVAQGVSESILITDDHKTHVQGSGAMVADGAGAGGFYPMGPASTEFEMGPLPISQSMIDLPQQGGFPFTSSRSTGNLQGLGAYGIGGGGPGQQQQRRTMFNPHSHIHHLPQQQQPPLPHHQLRRQAPPAHINTNTGYQSSSQATSATMTPTSCLSRPGSRPASRPASPTMSNQPMNKKRKSSSGFTSFLPMKNGGGDQQQHRRMPSGLTMTPRVETSGLGLASGMSSAAASVTSPFASPGGQMVGGQGSFMAIPTASGAGQWYGSGPPTPSEGAVGPGGQGHWSLNPSALDQHLARAQNQNAAYFSQPASAVPSRASSPVLQHSRGGPGGALAAYARQQTMPMPTRQTQQQQYQTQQTQQAYQQLQQHQQQLQAQMAAHNAHQQHHPQSASTSTSTSTEPDTMPPPTISRILPAEGPVAGGTEVSIYGHNFTNSTQILFGDKVANTNFYGSQSLLATAPPSRPGGVNISCQPNGGASVQYSPPTGASGTRQIFTYTEQKDPRMMEMALRFVSQQQTGNQMGWGAMASSYASRFVDGSVGRAGIGGQQREHLLQAQQQGGGGFDGGVNGGGHQQPPQQQQQQQVGPGGAVRASWGQEEEQKAQQAYPRQ